MPYAALYYLDTWCATLWFDNIDYTLQIVDVWVVPQTLINELIYTHAIKTLQGKCITTVLRRNSAYEPRNAIWVIKLSPPFNNA